MKDYYKILGIPHTASDAEIKKAYRKLVLLYHPDKNNGSKQYENLFIEINDAYNTLSNTNRRIIYDYDLAHPYMPQPVQTIYRSPYYNIQKPKYQYKRAVDERVGWKPYAAVASFLAVIILISVLITPIKKEKSTNNEYQYSVLDGYGNVMYQSREVSDVKSYLDSQNTKISLYKTLDSLMQTQQRQ